MSEVNRVWRLRKRPTGAITDDVLRFEEEALPEPGETLKKLYTGANTGKLMIRVKDV